MASAIAKVYARRIKRGEIAIEDVPESIREQVAEMLQAQRHAPYSVVVSAEIERG